MQYSESDDMFLKTFLLLQNINS